MAVNEKDNKPIILVESPNLFQKQSPLIKNESKIKHIHFKQIAKRSLEIIQTSEGLRKISKIKCRKEFVSPLEISIKNKRWDEFLNFTKRSLLIIKMKVSNVIRLY